MIIPAQRRTEMLHEQITEGPLATTPTPDASGAGGMRPGNSTNVFRMQEADIALPSLLTYATTWRILAWWTIAYGAASWLTEYLFSLLDPRWPFPFLYGIHRVVYAVLWTGNILIAITATERFPVISTRQIGRMAFHIALCFVVTIAWGVSAYWVCVLIVPGWKPEGVGRMLATTAQNVLFGYSFLLVLVHIILRMRLHRQREINLAEQSRLGMEAQLQVMKMELQPHFLFNALHAVSSLIHSDPSAANDTLVLVSDMLRHAVKTSRVQEVSLEEELAAVQLYTEIVQVRFGDRLRLVWDIAPETLDAAVPHMLLQPLVENAVKHGLEARSDAGLIYVGSRRVGDTLSLKVRDDGPGIDQSRPHHEMGVGIKNTRERLVALYGTRQTFQLSSLPERGAEVLIRIPFAVAANTSQSAVNVQAG